MRTAMIALLLALMPLPAAALETSEILELIAMPLAVAAVSEATGVPAADLGNVVAALNRADVPPAEFVQVIRYVPVALAVEDTRPQFVQFVETEVSNGVTGTRLVRVIDDRLRTYDVTPQFVAVTDPAPVYVLSESYVPPMVVTRVTELRTEPAPAFNLDTEDLLALIALPLAVDALSGTAGISATDIAQLVASLNAADIEPVRLVEVVRLAPVALVRGDDRDFVRFVRTEVDRGVRGDALVQVIERRFDDSDRVAVRRDHPHGGPPGQLKKQLGLKTGAEVVHRKQQPVVRVVDQTRRDKPKDTDKDRLGRGGPKIKRDKIDKDDRGNKANKGNKGNKGKKGNQGKGKNKP